MRRLSALCLFAAPVLVIVSELLAPTLSESGSKTLATVQSHLTGLYLWVFLGIAAAGVVVAAAMAMLRLAPHRGHTLGVVGASLTTVGALGYSAHNAFFLQLPAMLHGDRAEMARLYERGSQSASVGILTFFVFLIPLFMGLLLLGIAARRAHNAPTWPAVVLGLAFLPGFLPIPFDAGLVSFALLLVGLWTYGVVVLRTPTTPGTRVDRHSPSRSLRHNDDVLPDERVWRPSWPCAMGTTLSILRRGSADPTFRTDPDGTVWRGVRTPEGPATLRLSSRPADGEVRATAWGPGSDWALSSVPEMLGAGDDPAGFHPSHPVLADIHRRRPHWRVTRTGRVLEAVLPAIIEQKVTGQEALSGFRRLVYRFGERAPGAGVERGVWLQPSAETVRLIPSWEWLRLGIDPARSRAAVRAAQVAGSLERTAGLPADEVDRRLRSLPGVGVWTSAEVRFRAHGDADAVSFGDYHIAKNVGWALTGEEIDDDGLAELLEPYRPHRYRVQRLIELAGLARPRRGPRMAPRRHLPAS